MTRSRSLIGGTSGVYGTAVLTVLLASVSTSQAQRQGKRGRAIDGVRFDAHLDLGWHGALGVGFRADIPIVEDGFIDGVHDELAISPGVEIFFWDYGHHNGRHHHGHDHDGVGLWPLVAAQWNFYINREWSVFPELGLLMGFYRHDHDDHHSHNFLSPFLSVGARYHFSDRNAFLMRLNWPAGLQLGLTF